jgi:hypothetical protein
MSKYCSDQYFISIRVPTTNPKLAPIQKTGPRLEAEVTIATRSRPRSGYSIGSSLGGSVYASTILSMDDDNDGGETDEFLQGGANGLNDQQWVLQVRTETLFEIVL